MWYVREGCEADQEGERAVSACHVIKALGSHKDGGSYVTMWYVANVRELGSRTRGRTRIVRARGWRRYARIPLSTITACQVTKKSCT